MINVNYFKILSLILIICFLGCKKDKPRYVSEDGYTISSEFTILDSAIKLNPSGNAPLSALLVFQSTVQGHTEIIVKGKHGASSDVKQVFNDNSSTHSIPILGLYPNFKNTVEVYVVGSDNLSIKSVISITTGALPINVPNYINTDVVDLTQMEPGMNLVSGFSGYPIPPATAYITDSFGDIRWILDFSNQSVLKTLFYDCGVARLQNGNYYFADIGSHAIFEVDILGKIINTWSIGTYIFHHNVIEKPNGNFLITVTDPTSTHIDGSPTTEDYMLEIDRLTGKIINTWDLKQSLDEYRQTLGTDPQDWLHANGIIFDPTDNTVILSGRVQGVVKLTSDNKIKWILGAHRGWGKNRRGEDLNQYLLTPLDAQNNPITDTLVVNGYAVTADFEWNWYQHSPALMPSGDLLLFDNGSTREYNATPEHHYSRAVEYKIDETNKTVKQIWQFGKEENENTFSNIVSSVQYLPETNHILFSPGFAVPNTTGAGGKIVEVDYLTKKVLFQQSVSSANSWGWHRAKRISLYPNGNSYQ